MLQNNIATILWSNSRQSPINICGSLALYFFCSWSDSLLLHRIISKRFITAKRNTKCVCLKTSIECSRSAKHLLCDQREVSLASSYESALVASHENSNIYILVDDEWILVLIFFPVRWYLFQHY